MAEFDTWIGWAIRWSATVALAAFVVGVFACVAMLSLDYAWKRMSMASRLAWIAVMRRIDIERMAQHVAEMVTREREKQEREAREEKPDAT